MNAQELYELVKDWPSDPSTIGMHFYEHCPYCNLPEQPHDPKCKAEWNLSSGHPSCGGYVSPELAVIVFEGFGARLLDGKLIGWHANFYDTESGPVWAICTRDRGGIGAGPTKLHAITAALKVVKEAK